MNASAVQALDPQCQVAAPGVDLRLWLVDLDADAWASVPASLSGAEQKRAARFVRRVDRDRYVASHAALRCLLGESPASACRAPWAKGLHGKPALASLPHFNMSRRDGVALIGISATHEIGVDVETLHPFDDAQQLADLHFTPRERADLARVADEERERNFLLGWTRKEACLKAMGCGLSLPPSSFECGVHPMPARVSLTTAQRDWTLVVHSPDGAGAQVVVSWAVVVE